MKLGPQTLGVLMLVTAVGSIFSVARTDEAAGSAGVECVQMANSQGTPMVGADGAPVTVIAGEEPPVVPKGNFEPAKDLAEAAIGVDPRRPLTDPELEPSYPLPPLDLVDMAAVHKVALAC